jgi:septation ring formation regulator EzrA
VSEHDKIRGRLSSAIEKIKKLSEEHGDLDLDAARMAIHLAQDELEIAQAMIRREIIAERNGR